MSKNAPGYTHNQEIQSLLNLAIDASREAGKLITFNRPSQINAKSSEFDLVTELDRKAESIIRDILESTSIAILGEEYGGSKDLTDTWVIDPIDGTYNFVKGSPLVGTNIALIRDNQPILAVTNLPFLNEIYTSVKGSGVYYNDFKLERDSFSALEFEMKVGPGFNRSTWRILGAASVELAWLSRGIFTEVHYTKVAPWDVAPGILFTTEMGGSVSSSNSIYWDDAHFKIKEDSNE